MVVVDTSVWIDLLASRPVPQVALLHVLWRTESLGLGDLVLCEVLQGVRSDADRDLALRELLRFELVDMVGAPNAMAAADHYRALRMGVTVRGTVDCLIATYCIRNHVPLLHNDRDFDPFEEHLGLQVVR